MAILVVDHDDVDDESFSACLSEEGDDVTDINTVTDEEKQQQDEIKEIRKKTQKETFQVRRWRVALTGLLVATAVAVTVTTYHFLDKDEYKNFEIAYEQFARTVANAAVAQQQDLRDAIAALSNTISVSAENNNGVWPYFYPPKFQLYAEDFMRISSAEFTGLNVIVDHADREQFIDWSNQHYEAMVQESHMVAYGNLDSLNADPSKYNPFVSRKDPETGTFVPDIDRDYYSVRLSESPPPQAYGPTTNLNIGSIGANGVIVSSLVELKNETLVSIAKPFQALPAEVHQAFHKEHPEGVDYPHSFFYYPIRRVANDISSDIVATINVAHAWDVSMRKLLPETVNGIYCVVRNNCGQVFTFVINGHDVVYLGEDDYHDTKYGDKELQINLTPHTHPNFDTTAGHCTYEMQIYPSDSFKAAYDTNVPIIFATAVAATFGLVVLVFLVYDIMVKRRNDKLVNNAAQSNALVSSLFPGMLRDRVLDERAEKAKQNQLKHKEEQQQQQQQQQQQNNTGASVLTPTFLNRTSNLKAFLNNGSHNRHEDMHVDSGKAPLADLYPDTTVIFADLVGFTAWSSARDPGQVFTLLETIYGAFDKMTKRRKVFKVETIGDCYVAVAGVPEPLPDHAVAMARFSQDCMGAMAQLTKKLDHTLGPGTRDLLLRVGLHSGPVIAGVLRGERARFQLFGDTMNTAARMESTSDSGRIQVSAETARLLFKSGKDQWLVKRENMVDAKGKGQMQTYWLNIKSSGSLKDHTVASTGVSSEVDESRALQIFDQRTTLLIDWNTKMLQDLLKQVMEGRDSCRVLADDANDTVLAMDYTMPLEEVAELIDLSHSNGKTNPSQKHTSTIKVDPEVAAQLRDYVSTIATMYHFNSFHSFEHASHVAMSVAKLLSRIVVRPLNDSRELNNEQDQSMDFVDHTCCLLNDPTTQLACVFAALIHDVGHTGVPNSQLQNERPELGVKYKNRSLAEQNSIDVAWDLLMEGPYSDLRAALWVDAKELKRFRQIVVNCIMATDLFDNDLKALRQDRWDKAFTSNQDDDAGDIVKRKGTILIEHLIQASDISHTMQDWHVYCKWNERLFEEMYMAYKQGRATKNPTDFWYQGELNFFDFYVIPLAKKLRDFGVFGLSSDEYLAYALKNRDEWKAKGQGVLLSYLEKANTRLES